MVCLPNRNGSNQNLGQFINLSFIKFHFFRFRAEASSEKRIAIKRSKFRDALKFLGELYIKKEIILNLLSLVQQALLPEDRRNSDVIFKLKNKLESLFEVDSEYDEIISRIKPFFEITI